MNRLPIRPALFAVALLMLPPATTPAGAQRQEPATHLIQISLLAAAKSGPSELTDLPANTRQAIEDVRQFLPYKSYRLLTTGLLRIQTGARTTLTDPQGRVFFVALSLGEGQQPGSLLVRSFELQEKSEPKPPLVSGGGDRVAPVAPSSRNLLSSSFAAEIGQPVVVGTSRLDGGDEALMVLFTALP